MQAKKPLYPTIALVLTVIIGCAAEPDRQAGDPVDSRARVDQAQPVPIAPPATGPLAGDEAASAKAGRSQPQRESVDELRAMPSLAAPGLDAAIRPPSEPLDRERYAHFDDNPVTRVAEHPVSTFSIDVDTGAYSNLRRVLNAGRLPREDAVRVEEMINYFAYAYPTPADRNRPFTLTTELGPTPWNPDSVLLHVGIKGYESAKTELPPANLVFLVDVSGSMRSPDKLGLLKTSLRLLVRQLRAQDRIALVVYAGASGVVLEPTPGDQRATITAALDALSAGGSTNGAAGIRLAYAMAEQGYIPGGINRVLLATDGDFNVGTVDFEALKDLIERKREGGVGLTTLGFGTGNYNDHLMEQLADHGNGHYAYIDTLKEAQKVLVEEMTATLETIAKDVKIQIEFNPVVVAEYRLIGYENRALRREDFNNDRIDAGDIGAGHTVTALYELVLVGGAGRRIEPLRYRAERVPSSSKADELAHLRLRYKAPEASESRLIERVISRREIGRELARTSESFRFSASVAAFGQLLRGGRYTGEFDYDAVLGLAGASRSDDPFGYRGEFLNLVQLAKALGPTAPVSERP
ncbi:MAG: VWA domain-containing protein [Chromatiales bacterium]|jgi:Ca-activated chloride channel family protein